jgi:2-polyprenyl-6-methoxyphenol hydroxylase-like FAD-dependent oxidoreductase
VCYKGGYQQLRAARLDQFRQSLVKAVPEFADRVAELQEWKQIALLSVESNRLKRWHRPGLLLIGDAAHVMSPVGSIGINYEIADAVVAANLIIANLKAGVAIEDADLAAVQRQREWPTRLIQAVQSRLQ